MNAKPGHASYHLESQVDLQIAGDSIKGANVRADIGALRRRWPCCHMPDHYERGSSRGPCQTQVL